MIYDITTTVSNSQRQAWLEESTQPFVLSGHIGTHLDTYLKTDIPLESIKSQGIYIDVRDIAEKREIEISDLNNIELMEHSFVIFHTGRIDDFQYGSEEYFKDHPQLSHDLIEHLSKHNLNFVGIDCSGIRRGTEHEPADKLLEERGIYVIENLCNLSSITSPEFIVHTMWLDNDEMTGLPCRVLIED